MDLGLWDKAAVVAASSRGLGKACAMALAAEGARVAVNGREAETVEAAAEEIRRATDGQVLAVPADVSTEEGCRRLIDATVEAFGRLDILVSNAGGPPSRPALQVSDEQWRAALETNLMSAVRLSRLAVPPMRRAGGGRILFITSFTTKTPMESMVLSNAVRLGVVGLARTLANELAADNILVNCVAPGPIATERLSSLTRGRAERDGISFQEAERLLWTGKIPMGRVGLPEEFGSVVCFLASERASFVTGQAVNVDGGIHRGVF